MNKVNGLIAAAIAALSGAIALAFMWPTALPLFAAAALVASVSVYFIPEIKKALNAYAACRGPSESCRIAGTIDTLGQVAAALSAVAFAVAGAMQIAALGFLYSLFLSWLAPSLMAAVALLVKTGTYSCGVAILLLLGVLSSAWSFKKCMDQQQPNNADIGGVTIR